MTTKRTYKNLGLTVELDRDEVHPDDPGQGTPAMVYWGAHSASLWCVIDTGSIDGKGELSQSQYDWLFDLQELVDEFLYT